MKKKYYVYMHLYNSQPVYIGKGSVRYNRNITKGGYDDRAYNKTNTRNKKYLNFVKEVGKDNIEVKIVARFDDEQEALWLEDELHEVYDNLYSTTLKISSSGKNNGMYGKQQKFAKPIIQLTLAGDFIKEYRCAQDAIGFDHRNINMCCNKKRCTYKGFRWLFADEYYSGNYSFKKDTKKKEVVAISKDYIKHFNSYKECSNYIGCNSNKIKQNKNNYSKNKEVFVFSKEDYNGETYEELLIKNEKNKILVA